MTTPPKLDVWILAGQSNMQGHGLLGDPRVPPPLASDPRVWSFSSSGSWGIAEEPLHRLWESFTPFHQAFLREHRPWDRPFSDEELAARPYENGAGLGLAFGIAMAEGTGRTIGLLPAAQGGASLEVWSPAKRGDGGRSLYGGLLERVTRARAQADIEITGVLWYQGESDGEPGAAETYAERLSDFIADLREDLGDPLLPFLAVQIARVSMAAPPPTWTPAAWEIVREVLRTLPERVPHTGVVSAIDLELNDGTHVDTPGLIRLGRRLARLALTGTAPTLRAIERGPDNSFGLAVARVLCDGVEGGWTPATRIPGFAVRGADGRARDDVTVISASTDARDPRVIDVTLSSLDDDVRLGYGLGFDPVCSAVDAADQALPAFAPRPVAVG